LKNHGEPLISNCYYGIDLHIENQYHQSFRLDQFLVSRITPSDRYLALAKERQDFPRKFPLNQSGQAYMEGN